ncbi:predicted protein [Botrytis cinerea T4]|uniref:Uncharacterized protein n=1 Tax=Botryotinia fuckeliana (strain T4) TaxID=999810 RepID=G2Y4Y0_BOTF4|nr:predicted protein [Botrytis cinerea T4]
MNGIILSSFPQFKKPLNHEVWSANIPVDSILDSWGHLRRPIVSRVQEAAYVEICNNTEKFLLFSQSVIPAATVILHHNLRLAGLTDKSNTSRLIYDEGYAGIKDQASLETFKNTTLEEEPFKAFLPSGNTQLQIKQMQCFFAVVHLEYQT